MEKLVDIIIGLIEIALVAAGIIFFIRVCACETGLNGHLTKEFLISSIGLIASAGIFALIEHIKDYIF